MKRFATGFRPDPPGTRYRSHAVRSPLRAPTILLGNSDLSQYRAGRVFQGEVGSCVFETVKRAAQLQHAIHHPGSDPFLLAEIPAYAAGRKFEVAQANPGVEPEQLPTLAEIGDVGAWPELALQAVREIGFVLESDSPGPASGRTDWQTMLDTEPDDAALVKAFDAAGIEFLAVDFSSGFQTTIRSLLQAGCPVMLAINCGGIMAQDPGESVVQKLPTSGQDHYVLALSGDSNEHVLLDNWWDDSAHGSPWGIQSSSELRGCWRCSWSALDRGASNVLAFTGLPKAFARKEAA